MADLAARICVPCTVHTLPVPREQRAALLTDLDPEWSLVEDRLLRRVIRLRDFAGPLAMAQRIGALAQESGHHPDLHVHWGRLIIEFTTHAIKNLSEADFVMAARVDRLLAES